VSDDDGETTSTQSPTITIKTESPISTKIKTEHPNLIQHPSDFQSTVLLSLTQLIKNQEQLMRSITKCVEHLTVMSSIFNEQPVQKALRELMEKRANRAVDAEGSGLESDEEEEEDEDEAVDEKKRPRTIDEKLAGKLASTNTETGTRESLPRQARAAFYDTLDGEIKAQADENEDENVDKAEVDKKDEKNNNISDHNLNTNSNNNNNNNMGADSDMSECDSTKSETQTDKLHHHHHHHVDQQQQQQQQDVVALTPITENISITINHSSPSDL